MPYIRLPKKIGKSLVFKLFILISLVVNQFIGPFAVTQVSSSTPETNTSEAFKEIERFDLRDKYSRTIQKDEKTFETEISAAPIHYKVGNKYHEINNNITREIYGSYDYRNVANEFVFRAGDTLDDGLFFSGFGKMCEFRLSDVSNTKLNGQARAHIDDNILTYKNIYKNADLEVVVTPEGIITNVVAHETDALKDTITFDLQGCGANVFDKPIMSDVDSGSEIDFDTTTEDEVTKLTLKPNYEELGEIKGVVKIDPSITFSDNMDTFVSPSTLWIDNGTRRALFIGTYTDFAAPGDPVFYRSRALIRTATPNLPTGAIVTDAKLRVYHYGTNAGQQPFYVSKITSGWGETTVNPGPSHSGDYGSTTFPYYNSNFTAQARDINVNTSLISQLQSDNSGLMLRNYDENARGVVICSKEIPSGPCAAGNQPKLIVEYVVNQPPSLPRNLSPSNLSEYSGNCNESVSPSTGTCRSDLNVPVRGDVNDPDTSSQAQMDYSRFEYSGANNFNSSNKNCSGSCNGSSWRTVSDNSSFSDGTTSWRLRSYDRLGENTASGTRRFTTDTTPPSVPNPISLPQFTGGVGITNTAQVEPRASKSTDNVSSRSEIEYYLQYSKQSNFSTVYEYGIWQQDDPTFEVGEFGPDSTQGTADDLENDETYYFRIKARDGLNNTSAYSSPISTTIDVVKPVVTDLNVTEERISPNNSSSVGSFDDTEITVDFIEKYPASIRVELNDFITGNTLKTFNKNLSSLHTNESVRTESFLWDGTDNAGNFVADSTYQVIVTVTDKATNTNDNTGSYDVTVDNNEANITVSAPIQDFWTNQSMIDISGQALAPNDPGENDQDISSFEIRNNQESVPTWHAITFDPLSPSFIDFNENVPLLSGLNSFNLRTIDTVDNTLEIERRIYRENLDPEITNVVPDGLTNNLREAVSFTITDDNKNGSEQISEIEYGTNPDHIDLKIIYETLDSDQNIQSNTKELFESGVNLDPGLVSDLVCSPSAGSTPGTKNGKTVAESIDCSFSFINDLQPDSNYRIEIDAEDTAGNSITNNSVSFELDSFTYNDISTPVDGGTYSNSEIIFSGTGEINSQLQIENAQLSEVRNFTLNQALDGVGEDGNFVMSDFEVTCGQFIDIDNRADTPDVENCNWEVSIKQDFVNADSDTFNNNIITITDPAGNTIVENRDIVLNIYSFDLTIEANRDYFSPNGDGSQDSVNFSHTAVNPDDTLNPPNIDSYSVKIFDDTDNVVWEFNGTEFLPADTFFSGRLDSGEWIPDGVYTYELEVTTFDGAVKTVPINAQNIRAVTDIKDDVVITNPADGAISTNGVINVAGQGPMSQILEGDPSLLRGDIQIRICIDTVGTSVGCDTIENTTADENGLFSTLVVLPRIEGQTQTIHNIKAYAYDQYGNQTDYSNTVEVTVDTLDPFKSVSVIPTFTGVSDTDLYERYLNGDPDVTIDDLRSLIIRSEVTENTEYVDLSFADMTNLKTRDGVSYNYIERQEGVCNDASGCVWDTRYPVPSDFGGTYEIEFEGKKGDTVQTLTAGFKADGSIPTQPYLVILEKYDADKDQWIQIDPIEKIHYTNNDILRIVGLADPGTDLNIYSNGNQIGSTTSGVASNKWEFEFDVNDVITLNGASCNDTCTIAEMSLTAQVDDPIDPIESANSIEITYDIEAPSLTEITRQTPAGTVNGWLQSGDEAQYTILGDEKLLYADLVKEDSFVKLLTNVSSNEEFQGTINVEQSEEGYYNPKFRIIDYAGNRTDYDAIDWETIGLEDFRLYVDNTAPDETDIDESNWSTEWSEGGVNADGIYPEVGRLNPGYVIRDGGVFIFGIAEYDQRVQIYVNGEIVDKADVETISGCRNLTDDKTANDNLITKYGTKCNWLYQYTFPGDGDNDKFGVPQDGYIFQVRTIDKAANESDISHETIIYDDRQRPSAPEVTRIDSSSYQPIPGFQAQTEFNLSNISITKDTSIDMEFFAERYSDINSYLLDQSFEVVETKLFTNSSDRKVNINYVLGSNQRDGSRSDCMRMVGARRVGMCDDGNYIIQTSATDAAGNTGDASLNIVERDTVSPLRPTVEAYMLDLDTIGFSVRGEPGTDSSFGGNLGDNGFTNVVAKRLDINNENHWERPFTYCATLTDSAGNVSGESCSTVITPIRPPRDGECQDALSGYLDSDDFENYMEEADAIGKCVSGEYSDGLCKGFVHETHAERIVSKIDNKSCQTYAKDSMVDALKDGFDNNWDRSTVKRCIATSNPSSVKVENYENKYEDNVLSEYNIYDETLGDYCDPDGLLEDEEIQSAIDSRNRSETLQAELQACLSDPEEIENNTGRGYGKTSEDAKNHTNGCFSQVADKYDLSEGENAILENQKADIINQMTDLYDDYREQIGRGNTHKCESTWQIWRGNSCASAWVKEYAYIASDLTAGIGTIMLSPSIVVAGGINSLLGGDANLLDNFHGFVSDFNRKFYVGLFDTVVGVFELATESGFYIGSMIENGIGDWEKVVQDVQDFKQQIAEDTGYEMDGFKNNLGDGVVVLFTVLTVGIGGIGSTALKGLATGANIILTGATYVIAEAAIDTVVECMVEQCNTGLDLAITASFNLVPNVIPGGGAGYGLDNVAKQFAKGADEVTDGAGNVIRKIEFQNYLKLWDSGVRIEWVDYVNIRKNIVGNLSDINLNKGQIDNIVDLTKRDIEVDVSLFENVNLPAGAFRELDASEINNVLDLYKKGGSLDDIYKIRNISGKLSDIKLDADQMKAISEYISSGKKFSVTDYKAFKKDLPNFNIAENPGLIDTWKYVKDLKPSSRLSKDIESLRVIDSQKNNKGFISKVGRERYDSIVKNYAGQCNGCARPLSPSESVLHLPAHNDMLKNLEEFVDNHSDKEGFDQAINAMRSTDPRTQIGGNFLMRVSKDNDTIISFEYKYSPLSNNRADLRLEDDILSEAKSWSVTNSIDNIGKRDLDNQLKNYFRYDGSFEYIYDYDRFLKSSNSKYANMSKEEAELYIMQQYQKLFQRDGVAEELLKHIGEDNFIKYFGTNNISLASNTSINNINSNLYSFIKLK